MTRPVSWCRDLEDLSSSATSTTRPAQCIPCLVGHASMVQRQLSPTGGVRSSPTRTGAAGTGGRSSGSRTRVVPGSLLVGACAGGGRRPTVAGTERATTRGSQHWFRVTGSRALATERAAAEIRGKGALPGAATLGARAETRRAPKEKTWRAWLWCSLKPRNLPWCATVLLAALYLSGHGGVLHEVGVFMGILNGVAAEAVASGSEASKLAINGSKQLLVGGAEVLSTSSLLLRSMYDGVDLANVTARRRHGRFNGPPGGFAAWRRCAASGADKSGDPADDDNDEASAAGSIWSTHMPWTCPQIDLTGSFQMVSSSACACAAKFSPFSAHSSANQEDLAVGSTDN